MSINPYLDPDLIQLEIEVQTLNAEIERLHTIIDEARRDRLEAIELINNAEAIGKYVENVDCPEEDILYVGDSDHIWQRMLDGKTIERDVKRAAVEAARRSLGAANGDRTASRMKWLGDQRELIDMILELRRRGKLDASSDMNALEQAAAHFVAKDGRPLKPRSMLQNISNRTDEGK